MAQTNRTYVYVTGKFTGSVLYTVYSTVEGLYASVCILHIGCDVRVESVCVSTRVRIER